MTRPFRWHHLGYRLLRVGLVVGLGLQAALVWPIPPSRGVDIAGREKELLAVRAQIAALGSRLQEIRGREHSLEQELDQVQAEFDLQKAQVDEASRALDLASAQVAASQVRVGELEKILAQIQQDLKRRLTGLYLLGRHGYLRLFFSMSPDENLLPAIRQLRFLVLRDRRTLDRYEATRAELAAEHQSLAQHREGVAAWQAQEKARLADLAAVRQRRAELLARVAAERQDLLAQQTNLQDRALHLTRFLNALLSGDQTALQGRPIQNYRGILDWPVRPDVLQPFGPRKDPRYRTEIPHHGVDLRTARGDKIHSIFPGEVIYAADFEGYGPMVVVHHPGKVFSLYAGLELLNVRKGDMVSLGDVLGTAAESLYFEIRVDNEPQDPARWMR